MRSGRAATIKRRPWLDTYFYFGMSLLIAVVVVYGFSHTADKHLIHATPIRPWLLWVHAAVFSGWVVFFIFQSALVRTHHVRLHRRTGWFGVALGTVIPVLGLSTAVVMDRFDIVHSLIYARKMESYLIAQVWEMISFAVPFWLAVSWRRKPELHRRLVLVATCALTSAAFSRFPRSVFPHAWFYAGVDMLIALGVARDLIVSKRVHAVYSWTLAVFIPMQIFVMHTYLHSSVWWVRISHAILGA